MQTPEQTIKAFYNAFIQKDGEAMGACYHPNIIFEDPAFGRLEGEEAKAMWMMLCANGKDLQINFSDIKTTQQSGSAKWEAHYTFSQTGRHVHNRIQAAFKFQDGLIIRHTDQFNLHKWASQAFGFKGWLLGNTGFFRRKLQSRTQKMLDNYRLKQS